MKNEAPLRLRIAGIACLLLMAVMGVAQTPPAQPATPGAQSPEPAKSKPEKAPEEKTKSEQEKAIEKKEQSQRLLGVLPEFEVTDRRHAPPLTPKEKFHLFSKSAFDPVELGIVGLQAGISQKEDEFSGYGQGAQGFGKRYGASLADEVSSSFWSNFFWATTLKEDPRYFRLGHGPFLRRLGYSLAQAVVCRTDAGNRSFSWSNALGALTSGGLSNAYYPESDRGFGLTMSRAGIALMYGAVGGLPDEFWPDIRKKLFHKHHAPEDGTPTEKP